MNQPSPYLIAICSQFETQLCFKIKNIADAQAASQLLAIEKLHISPHTIARLFGVVKPFRTPYKDTLNVIARYLDFIDWEDFCTNQTIVPFDPNFFLTEASDGFSLAVLQLALINEDIKALHLVLDKAKYHENETIRYTAAELIGTYIRKSNNQKQLLQLLADSSIGHLFFYECYVDEDNDNNYFSEALINYYLPNIDNDYRRLYVYSFLISQAAHKKQIAAPYIQEFEKLILHLDKNKCHFHELSRWMECLILIDGYNGVLQNTWKQHLQKLITLSVGFHPNEKIWLFSRSLKALLLFKIKEELFHFNPLNDIIDSIIKKQTKEMHSVALYAIQLYWISKSIYFKSKIIYTPFRIHNLLFQNESNEKSAIEFAVASLFATGENKKIIDNNMITFCQGKGMNWVTELVN